MVVKNDLYIYCYILIGGVELFIGVYSELFNFLRVIIIADSNQMKTSCTIQERENLPITFNPMLS